MIELLPAAFQVQVVPALEKKPTRNKLENVQSGVTFQDPAQSSSSSDLPRIMERKSRCSSRQCGSPSLRRGVIILLFETILFNHCDQWLF